MTFTKEQIEHVLKYSCGINKNNNELEYVLKINRYGITATGYEFKKDGIDFKLFDNRTHFLRFKEIESIELF